MTRVTFLEHSGFLVELESRCLLFDWWKENLPDLPEKPLEIFVSHRHPDHFSPRIFKLDDGARDVRFFLSKDIRMSAHNLEKWGVSDTAADKCVRLGKNAELSLPGLEIRTLSSTDEGVAFLLRTGGRTIYHAGDLNWWHWPEDTFGERRNMEVNFKRYLEPLRGVRIDFAFAPLDPRLGDACGWGFRYLLEMAEIRRLFPMHQFGEFALTTRFLAAHPEFSETVVPVEYPGQSWEFSEAGSL